MAFKLPNGRSPFLKTGRDIPPTMMYRPPMRQERNPNTGEDLKKQALAIAEKKLQESIANKPLGGSTDVRTETGTATNIRPATTPAEIAAWRAGKDKPGAGRYNITETATATAQGADEQKKEEAITPKLPETPQTPQNLQTPQTPSRTIYSIQGQRGYTGSDAVGTRGFVTLNENRANQEVKFTELANATANEKYAQAEEGSAAARGLTGTALEKRNKEAERRRQALQRPMPSITTTEVDRSAAISAKNAMDSAKFRSNVEENKAKGIGEVVVYQKRSENKKTAKKKPPMKQVAKEAFKKTSMTSTSTGTKTGKPAAPKQMKKKSC